jgi:hypothetical protein
MCGQARRTNVETAPDELDPDVSCSFRDDATPLNVGGVPYAGKVAHL